ncbi:MAG TPA: esterase-like activity of phytase family protein [Sphingobium sp.]|uniref:esterase-like activity of phytase family protein n=1 Tax=Sphingobium sp. TaxID=1912891 RepID=UPI002ED50705
MERIGVILLVFVLLLNGRHPEHSQPIRPHDIVVESQALPLDQTAPERRDLGALRYLGGWSLTSQEREFGGISSMTVNDMGMIVALSDSGLVATFPAGRTRARGNFRALPGFPHMPWGERKTRRDTESMTLDPETGKVWVGYEDDGNICRYSAGLKALEGCARWPDVAKWPAKTSIESLARLSDGRFMAIAEDSPGPGGRDHDVLLFSGDPVNPATPPPARLSYVAPTGYLPTDAIAIGHGKLLVMNRRLTLMDLFTGIVMLVDIRDLRPGSVLRGQEVARLGPPIQHDNFEALAMSHENGQPVLWIASDDNFLFFQRSLLLKFAMPRKWFEGE